MIGRDVFRIPCGPTGGPACGQSPSSWKPHGSPDPSRNSLNCSRPGVSNGSTFTRRFGSEPPMALTPLGEVGRFRTVGRRTEKRRRSELVIRDGHTESRAELPQLLLIHLFLLMGDVASFPGFSQAVTFDRLRQNHGRLDLGVPRPPCRRRKLSVDRDRRAAVCGFARRNRWPPFEQPGIGAEEMFASEGAAFHRIFLISAVDDFAHPLHQQTFVVLRQQWIPIAAPNHLDDIPARAAENGFQFLNNLAVATHRTVQPLKIAVHDPNQIIQLFARGERQSARLSGSSVSPSPTNAHTLVALSFRPRSCR